MKAATCTAPVGEAQLDVPSLQGARLHCCFKHDATSLTEVRKSRLGLPAQVMITASVLPITICSLALASTQPESLDYAIYDRASTADILAFAPACWRKDP